MTKKIKNLFDTIPVICKHITTEYEGELAVIAFPRFRSKFMQKYFVPRNRSPIIRIRLDAHGTTVWKLIDGVRTTNEIVQMLTDHFQNEENFAYRIGTYVQQLQRQGFIKLINTEEGDTV
ncbi:MAG: PqqD family protein [Bacteroidales bacterium]|jgi:hypothetical protein|nr:PqqD family protein [Bacteroidales bacterium]